MPSKNDILSMLLISICLLLIAFGFINFTFALFSGIAIALAFAVPYQKTIQAASSFLLKLSIVLLGASINFDEVVISAKSGFWLTLICLTITLIVGLIIGKLLKLEPKLTLLITGGTAICGGSAIAALAPSIKAKHSCIVTSITIIFLLNASALVIYPIIGHWLQLSATDFGLWAALGIHDTSSVVGAAASFNESSLQVATSSKLARTLWIIPIVFIASRFFQSNNNKIEFPFFIILFILASIFTTYMPFDDSSIKVIKTVAKSGMAMSLFLIGLGFSRSMLQEIEPKALILAILLWILISVLSISLILYF